MSAPVAILHLLRFDQAPAAGPELARPVRHDGAVEAGTVLYEGCASLEDVQAYPDVRRGQDYAEYTSVAALESCAKLLRSLPVIVGELDAKTGNRLHPGQAKGALELVKADNGHRFPKVGMVMDAEVRQLDDGRHWLWVLVAIFDAEAIALIDSGKASALSLAYKPMLDETPGTFRGTPYSAVQTDRTAINHLLLTNRGRGGLFCELRADAAGDSPMTPEDIQALAAALAPILAPLCAAEMAKTAPTEDPTAEVETVAADAGDMVPKADLDAALAKLAELTKAAETAQVKADAAPLADAVQRHGLTVSGFDPAAPTAAGNAAAKEALLGVALRGDAASRSPLDIPAGPPPKDGEQATPTGRFNKLA